MDPGNWVCVITNWRCGLGLLALAHLREIIRNCVLLRLSRTLPRFGVRESRPWSRRRRRKASNETLSPSIRFLFLFDSSFVLPSYSVALSCSILYYICTINRQSPGRDPIEESGSSNGSGASKRGGEARRPPRTPANAGGNHLRGATAGSDKAPPHQGAFRAKLTSPLYRFLPLD